MYIKFIDFKNQYYYALLGTNDMVIRSNFDKFNSLKRKCNFKQHEP